MGARVAAQALSGSPRSADCVEGPSHSTSRPQTVLAAWRYRRVTAARQRQCPRSGPLQTIRTSPGHRWLTTGHLSALQWTGQALRSPPFNHSCLDATESCPARILLLSLLLTVQFLVSFSPPPLHLTFHNHPGVFAPIILIGGSHRPPSIHFVLDSGFSLFLDYLVYWDTLLSISPSLQARHCSQPVSGHIHIPVVVKTPAREIPATRLTTRYTRLDHPVASSSHPPVAVAFRRQHDLASSPPGPAAICCSSATHDLVFEDDRSPRTRTSSAVSD